MRKSGTSNATSWEWSLFLAAQVPSLAVLLFTSSFNGGGHICNVKGRD